MNTGDKGIIRTGSLVKLRNASKEGDYSYATVISELRDVEGGVVLDRPLAGFTCWNVADLRRVYRK